MFMSVSWDRLIAMSFLTVVKDRSVGISDTIRPRCPEADRYTRICQGKRRFICTNFSLLEVQLSLTIGLSFRTSSNIFGFEVGHTYTPLARCVRTAIRARTASALWWTAGARKKVTAARLLRDEKLTYPVRRFVFPLIYQLQAYCDRSDNDKEQCQIPEGRSVKSQVESSKIRKMARFVNNIVTIATRKKTRAVLLNDQLQSLSQTFIGTVNDDALLTQSTAASVAAIPFCRHWSHSGERRGIKTCFIWSTPLCHLMIGLLWHFQPECKVPLGLKQFNAFATRCTILRSSSSFSRFFHPFW